MRTEAISRSQWIGFFALCALGASAWLVESAWPSPLPGAERDALHNLILAAVLCAVGWRDLARGEMRKKGWLKLALASICLLGVPGIVVATTLGAGAEVTVAALFALLPVMVVVLVAAIDSDGAGASGITRPLLPALIGLGGTLLLLPYSEPDSWRLLGLEGAVVSGVLISAVASVWLYRLLRDFTVIEAAIVFCLANAIFAFVTWIAFRLMTGAEGSPAWTAGWTWKVVAMEVATSVCVDLPSVVLLVWLMREIAPERFAARYLVVPLLTVIEGYALVRPALTWRVAGGAVLVLYGAWRLLTGSQREEEPRLVLH